MDIRKATLDDLEGICAVAQAIQLDYRAPQESGFLVYVLDQQGYASRIAASPYFYVAAQDDSIVGFLMCYDDGGVHGLVREGALGHEDQLIETVAAQQGRYVFGDQIGIMPMQNMHGVGTALMHRLFEDMRKDGVGTMYVGVLHEPVMNIASRRFCERLGFTHRADARNADRHLWGVYRLELPDSTERCLS